VLFTSAHVTVMFDPHPHLLYVSQIRSSEIFAISARRSVAVTSLYSTRASFPDIHSLNKAGQLINTATPFASHR